MKQVAVFCVSYNSDEAYRQYRASLLKAAQKSKDEIRLDIFLARNTEEDNPGYFGGIQRQMKNLDITSYDYCILSNVDLTVEEDFFIKLAAYDCAEDTGWIAPRIWSKKENRDLNPKIRTRYSRKKLLMLRFLHRHHVLHALYSRTLYHRRRETAMTHTGPTYAGHGSFIILTRRFFKECGIINYPVFLFCEEIYLAELCRDANLQVIYVPDLIINDSEHISTGHMPSKTYSRLNYQAVDYILNHFYQE